MGEFAGEGRLGWGFLKGWGGDYERKVDLPQLASPRRRMVHIGMSSMP